MRQHTWMPPLIFTSQNHFLQEAQRTAAGYVHATAALDPLLFAILRALADSPEWLTQVSEAALGFRG